MRKAFLGIGGAVALAAGLSGATAAPSAGAGADLCLNGLPGSPRTLPTSWSERRRLVHVAVCEWAKFRYPTVVIRRGGDPDPLPGEVGLDGTLSGAVEPVVARFQDVRPATETQLRFGLTEDDPKVSGRIEAYWRATDGDYVSQMARVRAFANQTAPTGEGGNYAPGWSLAWSSAFASWAYRAAGIGWFPPDAWHTRYLRTVAERRKGTVVVTTHYRPLPGDLICFPRIEPGAVNDVATADAFLKKVMTAREGFAAHCDVVVRVTKTSVVSIGGNIRNSVAATVSPLTREGRLERSNVRPWSVALRAGGNYDPCARIEAVGLPDWASPAAVAARKRALARTECDALAEVAKPRR